MFDWSGLVRDNIRLQLYQIAPKLCNQTMSVDKFHKTFARYIKRHFPVIVSLTWDSKVKNHIAFVGGMYYSDYDAEDKKCIELCFVYNPEVEEFKITDRRFKAICTTIADTILHEVIHMRQYRRRDFRSLPNYASSASRYKTREEQEYLGGTDEIDAYGFNIACELLDKFKGDQKAVIKYLSLNQSASRTKNNSWKMYLSAFGHDHNHEIIKRVKKKVIRYLPRAEEGKPFKSYDWICY